MANSGSPQFQNLWRTAEYKDEVLHVFLLLLYPSPEMCFYTLFEREHQPRPVFGLAQPGWPHVFKIEQTQKM